MSPDFKINSFKLKNSKLSAEVQGYDLLLIKVEKISYTMDSQSS